jgi:predicted  nucleic acid-binding Zn-ribbon protein
MATEEAALCGLCGSEDIEREIVEAKVEIGKKEAQLDWLKDDLRGLEEQVREAEARREALVATAGGLHASAAALEDQGQLQHHLDRARTDLAQSRRAYQGG